MTDVTMHTENSVGEGVALREKAMAAKDAVVDLAGEAKRYAAHRVGAVKDKAVDMMGSAKSKASDVNDTIIGFVERNPYKSIAIAAGAGLLMGVLLKRRR